MMRIRLFICFCVLCGCTPVEDESDSDETTAQTIPVESQIQRDSGYSVSLSETQQSAKACSKATTDGFVAPAEYTNALNSLLEDAKAGKITLEELQSKAQRSKVEMMMKQMRAKTICEQAEMGSLSVGTRVLVLSPPDQCGPDMLRVKVLTGNHIDKIGCVDQEFLPEQGGPE